MVGIGLLCSMIIIYYLNLCKLSVFFIRMSHRNSRQTERPCLRIRAQSCVQNEHFSTQQNKTHTTQNLINFNITHSTTISISLITIITQSETHQHSANLIRSGNLWLLSVRMTEFPTPLPISPLQSQTHEALSKVIQLTWVLSTGASCGFEDLKRIPSREIRRLWQCLPALALAPEL